MITVTPLAAKHIQKMLKEKEGAIGMRLTLKQAGCSGFKYRVEAACAITDQDQVFESQGVKIMVDKKYEVFVDGTQIDFEQHGLNTKMVFNNPHVEDACGCGESVTFKTEEK